MAENRMDTTWNDIYNLFFIYDHVGLQKETKELFEYQEIDWNKVYRDYKILGASFDYAFLMHRHFVLIDVLFREENQRLLLKNPQASPAWFAHKLTLARDHLKNKNIIYLSKIYGQAPFLKVHSLEDFFAQRKPVVEEKEAKGELLLICDKREIRLFQEDKASPEGGV